jgi:ABC-type bacteriocin/lantibiotic exporter with double-glycine peptidase domain
LILPLIFQVVIDKVVVNNALSTMMILLIALLSANLFEIALTSIREYLLLHTRFAFKKGDGQMYQMLK